MMEFDQSSTAASLRCEKEVILVTLTSFLRLHWHFETNSNFNQWLEFDQTSTDTSIWGGGWLGGGGGGWGGGGEK